MTTNFRIVGRLLSWKMIERKLMLDILGTLIIGLVVGTLAKLIVP